MDTCVCRQNKYQKDAPDKAKREEIKGRPRWLDQIMEDIEDRG